MKSKDFLNLESRPDIVRWAESLRSYAPRWEHLEEDSIDPMLRFLSIDVLRRKHYVVVPFTTSWTSHTAPSFAAIKQSNFGRFYGIGFGYGFNGDKCLSCNPNHNELHRLTHEFHYLCVVAPQNEDFILLQTIYDYWLLAGAPDLIIKTINIPLHRALQEFARETTGEDSIFEVGKNFGKRLVDLYMAHNTQIMAYRRDQE